MEADIDPFMNGADGYRACILAARRRVAGLMGTPFNDTVLVDTASEAINAILRNFEPPLSADEVILDLSTAYGPFVGLYEWLGARQGVQLATVQINFPVTGPESFLEPLAAFLAANATRLNIRVAVISHVSAYPSVVLPVKEMVLMLRARGIPVAVDGAHALGNLPFSVLEDLGGPDYYFTNLHKWYFGSKSACALYVRRDRQLPHVPAPAVVDNIETQDFPDRACGERGARACRPRPALSSLGLPSPNTPCPQASFGRARATAPPFARCRPPQRSASGSAARPPSPATRAPSPPGPRLTWRPRGAWRPWRR